MNSFDSQYQQLLYDILKYGSFLETRGTKSKYLFSKQINVNLQLGFPASTLRQIYPANAIQEMFGFDLNSGGEISDKYLSKGLQKVWKQYTNTNILPHSYWHKFRDWNGHDQLQKIIDKLIIDTTSRSHVIQIFDPNANYYSGGMPTCGVSLIFSTNGDGYLDLAYFARSSDAFIGFAGDTCRYSALLSLVAHLTHMSPRYLSMTFANIHLYEQDWNNARLLVDIDDEIELPTLNISDNCNSIESIEGNWQLLNYQYSSIKLEKTKLNLGDLSFYYK